MPRRAEEQRGRDEGDKSRMLSSTAGMMRAVMIRGARRAFVRYSTRQGVDLAAVDAPRAVDLMISWYETEDARDAAPVDEDGDGLLFRWGTWDFEPPATFQYALIRQFIEYDGDEQCIRQLSLTLHYEPTRDSEALREEEAVWCFSRDDVPALRAAMNASVATSYVAQRRPVRAALDFEQVC